MQHLIKLAMRFLVFERILIEFPELHKTQKFRLRMDKFFVCQCSFLLFVMRPITRVLHRECGRNDKHFFERILMFCGNQHTCDSRINGKFGELPTQRRETLVVIDRTKLK